ncbi:type II secretion system protein GspM [Pseudoalteromonas sp. SSDWG2]|uniref:type II secretion system protein GspM n=1 Tax=Pseudoalteromonas sp. SSDWG2 TaxID=3139391 RepID=UPI003BAC3EA5
MSAWHEAQQRFGELQQREKVLILVVSLFCVVYLSVWFVISPATKKLENMQMQITSLNTKLSTAQAQEQAIKQAMTIDYKAKVRQKIVEQEELVIALDQKLQQLSHGFVSANKMPMVLSEVLAQQSGVQLIEFKVTGVEPVVSEYQKNLVEQKQEGSYELEQVLFRHNMELKLSGDYFSVQQYMQRLEQLSLKILITGFHYQVKDYPSGELTLNLATVSGNETFIIL